MIDEERSKRNRAFAWAIGLYLLDAVLLGTFRKWGGDSERIGVAQAATTILLMGPALYFWVRGHLHWAKGKGQRPWIAVLASIGIPIGQLFMAGLPDHEKHHSSVAVDPLCPCPQCGFLFRFSEYREDAEQIFCSSCKAEISRPTKAPNPDSQ